MAKDISSRPLDVLVPSSIRGDPTVDRLVQVLDPEFSVLSGETDLALILPRLAGLSEDVLDLLAWQFHVDFWDQDYPVERKQELIRSSIPWHRRKGTPWAVKHALAMLGIEAVIREWWELEAAPHTFGVEIWLGDYMGFDVQSLASIREVIDLTKPARSHLLSLTMGLQFEDLQPLSDAGLGIDAEVPMEELYPWPVRCFDGSWRFESGNRKFDGSCHCDGSVSYDPTTQDTIRLDQTIDVLGPQRVELHGLEERLEGIRRFDGSWRTDGETGYGSSMQPFDCGGAIRVSQVRRFGGSWRFDGGNTTCFDGRWKYDGGKRYSGGEVVRYGLRERIEAL